MSCSFLALKSTYVIFNILSTFVLTLLVIIPNFVDWRCVRGMFFTCEYEHFVCILNVYSKTFCNHCDNKCSSEALVQREIVSYAIFPARMCHLEVGMPLLQRVISLTQPDPLTRHRDRTNSVSVQATPE
jgi:hypothetical protein